MKEAQEKVNDPSEARAADLFGNFVVAASSFQHFNSEPEVAQHTQQESVETPIDTHQEIQTHG